MIKKEEPYFVSGKCLNKIGQAAFWGRPYWTYTLVLIFIFSCSFERENLIDLPNKKNNLQNNHFFINSAGDSIPTNVPLIIKGKEIDPQTVKQPKPVAYKRKPKTVPLRSNSVVAGQPKRIRTPQDRPTVVLGENGIPFPKKVIAKGKRVSALTPKPIPALLPQMKHNATMDIRFLDIEQNMATPSVWVMMEDNRKNLWFGTMGGGASLYDGSHFKHYTTREGLSDNHVFSMLEDSQGNLWFGTRNGGVSRYDGHHFTHFTTEGGLAHNFVMSMIEDSQGNLWFGTGDGVSRFDGTHFTNFTTEHGLVYEQVISVFEDSQQNIWIGTGAGTGLHRYDAGPNPHDLNRGAGDSVGRGKSITHYNLGEGQGKNDVHTMIEDSQGNLWFGTWGGGIIRFDGTHFEKFTTTEGLNDNVILSILEDEDGTIWFGGINNGVSQYTGTHFNHYTASEGLSSDAVRFLLKNSSGSLWACTWDTGVNLINKKGFTHFSTNEGLHQNRVSSILRDGKNNLWFGTSGGDLSSYDGKKFTHYSFPGSVIHNGPLVMYEDREDHIWIGTGSGVSRFDGISYMDISRQEGLSSSDVRAIVEDRKGNFWFGTQAGGVTRYDGKTMTHFTQKEGFISNDVYSILEDRKGNLWFGTLGGGVCRFDGQHFINYTKNEGLSNNYVRSIQEDEQGNLWFGTEGGLNRFDGSSFTQYTTKEGLIHNRVFAITIDKEQKIWATTEKGISVLIPYSHRFTNVKDSANDDYHIYNFKKEDGLKKTDFTPSNIVIDDQSKIWFGSTSGLKVLDLKDFEIPTTPPEQVELSHIEINEQYFDYQNLLVVREENKKAAQPMDKATFDAVKPFYNYPLNLSLPYDQNHLTFHFSAIDWAAPHKIHYSYHIEGVDKDWSIPRPEAKADYRNLPFGTHTFKVKAIGEAQVWSEPFEYSFTVRPPWWHSWWAYALYLLLTVGVAAWYIRRLRRRLAKEQSFNRQLSEANQQLQVLNVANSRFVPNDFLQILGKESLLDLHLGDQTETTMTILFADLRDYTALSETISPEDNFKLINAFLGKMGPIIQQNGGFICQYLGDGIMALFREKPELAIKAAIEMQQELQRYNKKRFVRNREALRLGIGLNTGQLMLGVIGDQNRYESSVISDAVNTASRMEGLTKIFGSSVIVSEKTLAEIGLLDALPDRQAGFPPGWRASPLSSNLEANNLSGTAENKLLDTGKVSSNAYRFLGKVKVKGKNQILKIYDFFEGDAEQIRQLKLATKADFEKAVHYYFDRKFGKAADLFKAIAKKFPEDIATEFYLSKAVKFVIDGVETGWSGAEEMVSK